MSNKSWRLQDAKNHFSNVVEAALLGEPQHVTRRGREVVVVVAADEFVRFKKFQAASMPRFVDYLPALPKDDVEFEQLPFNFREVEF